MQQEGRESFENEIQIPLKEREEKGQELSQREKVEESFEETVLQDNSYLNQLREESRSSPEKESSKKMEKNKLNHKKVKQKLNQQSEKLQEQGLHKEPKDTNSPNKSRLLKLCLEAEKALRTQAIDYLVLEGILKDTLRILEHRRQHDILIIRGARFFQTLNALVKRFPSLHRTEAIQSTPTLEMSLKLLKIMLSLTSSRQCFILNNHVAPLSTLLSSALMRDQKKIAVSCLGLLNLILNGPHKPELQPMVSNNFEYMLTSSLLRRLKGCLEGAIAEDDPSYCEFILLGFKFYHLVLDRCCEKELNRPLYGAPVMDNLSRAMGEHLEPTLLLMTCSLVQLVFEKEGESLYPRDDQLPNFKVNTILYLFKCLNVIFHANLCMAQKLIECNPTFLQAIHLVFAQMRDQFKTNHQHRELCCQIMQFMGSLACENKYHQDLLREAGLLEALANHPIQFLMEPLKHSFVPALCSLVHRNVVNLADAFKENSVLTVVQYIEKEMAKEGKEEEHFLEVPQQQSKALSRKTSVSSMNSLKSTYSKADSFSTHASGMMLQKVRREVRLDYTFRRQSWESLLLELNKIDD